MSESSNSEFDIVVQNKGVLPPGTPSEIYPQIKEFSQQNSPNVREVRIPLPDEESFDHVCLEKEMPLHEVSPSLLQFLDECKGFYNQVAQEEGYVKEGDQLEWKFVPIRKRDWMSISTEADLSSNAADIAGFYRNRSNIIYLIYPDDNPSDEQLYGLKTIAFHEARHRVSGHNDWFKVDIEEESEEELNLRTSFIKTEPKIDKLSSSIIKHDTNFSLLEEIFTVGFVDENIDLIADEDYQKTYESLKKDVAAKGGNPDFVHVGIKGVEGFREGDYVTLLEIYRTISKQIPDFSRICKKIRVGEVGSLNELAKEVINKFNKLALVGMFYAQADDITSLSRLLRYVVKDKQGETISPHATNQEIINDQVVDILEHAKARGVLSQSNITLLEELQS